MHQHVISNSLIWLLLSNCLSSAHGGRILIIPAHSMASHTKSMYPTAEALKNRGHDVFVLQLVDSPRQVSNKAGVVGRIISTTRLDRADDGDFEDFIEKLVWTKPLLPGLGPFIVWKLNAELCIQILSHNSTRETLYSILNEPWDVVIVDHMFCTCGIMAAQYLAAKGTLVVDYSTTILTQGPFHTRGVFVPASTHANFGESSYEPSKFSYRLSTMFDTLLFDSILGLLDFLIPHWGKHVGLQGFRMNALAEKSSLAVTMVPTGLDFTQARTFEITDFDQGCSIDSNLPEPLKSFLEDPSSKGTILLAMGHYANWRYAPSGALNSFLLAFSKLSEYRIIWQFSSKYGKPPNIPSNVLVESWIPQLAILNHPKTKLFISHMGLKSMQETVYAKIPAVALPMFAEQYRNTAISQYRAFALYLDKMNLSTDGVYSTIKRALDDPRYSTAVQRLQDQLSDRIRPSVDLITFQIEFLMRHRETIATSRTNRFLKTKWTKVPEIARWWQLDCLLVLASLIVASNFVIF